MSKENKKKAENIEEKVEDTGAAANEENKVEADDGGTVGDATFHNKYFGEFKIRGVVSDGKENGYSTITLKNDATHVVPSIVIARVITDKMNDHGGTPGDLITAAIAKDLLVLLNRVYHVRFSDIERITSFLATVAANDLAAATNILFGKHKLQVSLEEVDKILSENADKLNAIKDSVRSDENAQEKIKRAFDERQQRGR